MRTCAIALVLALLAGCQHSPDSPAPAGPVVFVDAAGNRMVVDTRSASQATASASGEIKKPVPQHTQDVEQMPFAGEFYVDATDVERDLDRRESERFFVIHDGMGGRQILSAGAVGAGEGRGGPPAETADALVWLSCRVIVSLVQLPSSLHHELKFPVKDDSQRTHAGYLIPVPPGIDAMTFWSYVKRETRAMPVLARVDNKQRVVAIVNNMPTQTIPETRFRYARVGGSVKLLQESYVSGFIALLDGALLLEKLPPSCGGLKSNDSVSDGQVSVQFRVTGDK